MSVITISRGTFSGGLMLADRLSQQLGYRNIGRDLIVERAALSGVPQEILQNALQKPPSFLERLKHSKYIYLCLIQAALSEEVRQGRAIYLGNAGHLLLKGAPVLRARIVAPLDVRLRMAQERLKLTRSQALDHIQRTDNDRRKWTQYIYGVDWTDPSLYDVVLNLEFMTVQHACDVLATLVTKDPFALTPESQALFDNLALSSRLRANLATNTSTEDLEVDVSARAGVVTIRGKFSSRYHMSEIERIARAVPGVKELSLLGSGSSPDA
ncbi:MAG: cytidylate kinase family protein [Acidobacteriota bacterium]